LKESVPGSSCSALDPSTLSYNAVVHNLPVVCSACTSCFGDQKGRLPLTIATKAWQACCRPGASLVHAPCASHSERIPAGCAQPIGSAGQCTDRRWYSSQPIVHHLACCAPTYSALSAPERSPSTSRDTSLTRSSKDSISSVSGRRMVACELRVPCRDLKYAPSVRQ